MKSIFTILVVLSFITTNAQVFVLNGDTVTLTTTPTKLELSNKDGYTLTIGETPFIHPSIPFPIGVDGIYLHKIEGDFIRILGVYENSVGDDIINASYVDLENGTSHGFDANAVRAELFYNYFIPDENGHIKSNYVAVQENKVSLSILDRGEKQEFLIDKNGKIKVKASGYNHKLKSYESIESAYADPFLKVNDWYEVNGSVYLKIKSIDR